MNLRPEDLAFHKKVSYIRLEEYFSTESSRSLFRSWQPQNIHYSWTDIQFNAQGQITACSDPREETRFLYDERDLLIEKTTRPIEETDPGEPQEIEERLEKRVYDRDGLLIEKSLEIGDKLIERSQYEYDERQRLVREQDLRQHKTFRYNEQGLCIEECLYDQDSHWSSMRYEYDETGHLLSQKQEEPVGRVLRSHFYEYSLSGLLLRYRLINQQNLVIQDLQYHYENFIGNDWLERFTYRSGAYKGKPISTLVQFCCRSFGSRQVPFPEDPFQSVPIAKGQYTGPLKNGQMQGLGFLQFQDGSSYTGDFEADQIQGYGVLKWSDGRKYRGYLANNTMEGRGTYYLKNGSFYEGTFLKGQLSTKLPYRVFPSLQPPSFASEENSPAPRETGPDYELVPEESRLFDVYSP